MSSQDRSATRLDTAESPKRTALALGIVLAIGASLRLPYLDYGLPATTYVDSFRFVYEAKSLSLASGSWEPDDVLYPGLLKLILAWIYGTFEVHSELWMHLLPRLLATLCDLGTIAALFVLFRRIGGLFAATVGAALYAVCIISITSARVETADCMVTFFLTAALAVVTQRQLKAIHFVLGGLLVGCAAGTKFSGGFGVLALAIGALLLAHQTKRYLAAGGLLCAATLIAAATFVATTPWIIPMHDVYWLGMKVQAEVQQGGQLGHVQAHPLDYLISPTMTPEQPWLASSLLYNLGPVVLVAGLAATGAAAIGRWGAVPLTLAAYTVGYYVLGAGTGHVKLIRYLLPVLPLFLGLAGLGVAHFLATRARATRWRWWLVLALLIFPFPLARSVPHLWAAARPLTNDRVYDWGKANLPRGARVLLSPFYVEKIKDLDVDALQFRGSAQRQYRLLATAKVDTEQTPLYHPRLVASMRQARIEYVVLNSYFEDSLASTPENLATFPKSVAAYRAFRQVLAAEADLVYSVVGHRAGRLGPDIKVYRLRGVAPRRRVPPQ